MSQKDLHTLFTSTRRATELMTEPLSIEDMTIQCGNDVSPVKWHLGHTTWFLEKITLRNNFKEYVPYDLAFDYLFNSYYETIGDSFPKELRGTISRPGVHEIMKYREFVTESVLRMLPEMNNSEKAALLLCVNHEQQHQELMLMDIKYNFFNNPLMPAYKDAKQLIRKDEVSQNFLDFHSGVREIGYLGNDFAFDNETPRHKEYVDSFKISNRLVTCEEYLAFMEDGGYQNPALWLSDGLMTLRKNGWNSPLYWFKNSDEWNIFTLRGVKKIEPNEPVSHISFYEADAYARWAGMRLPTESEWETAFGDQTVTSHCNLMESDILQPKPIDGYGHQALGDLWEWTASAYLPYHGSSPLRGEAGEYNHKFMSNQMVLRGGSYGTPASHLRPTYRNYYPPDKRWQFCGFRLAGDD